MLIRPAVPADVPAVLPMVNQICALHESWDWAKYGFLPNPAQRYERWLIQQSKSDRSVFLVAELAATESNETGLLAGFLIGTVEEEIPIYRLDKYGFIHDLWVEPNYRSAGVGRQLVKTAQQRFAHLGVKQIRLDTALANESARRLFQSCGFRISTIEMLDEL
jgi:ribosomal protein S18 acetylase RimI-like enzyme